MMNESQAAPANQCEISLPRRRFRMGSVDLIDVAPDLPPEEALLKYLPNYPHLRSATLGEPFLEAEHQIFRVEKPPVATKG